MAEINKDQLDKLLEDPKLRDELLKAMLVQKGASVKFEDDKVENRISDLKFRNGKLVESIDYKKGDFVIWKEKLKNKNFPLHGEPAIVIDIYETPIYDDSANIGSHIFKEPHDLLLGVIMNNGDFLTFHYDKRRFKKYR